MTKGREAHLPQMMVLFDYRAVARLPTKWPKKDIFIPFKLGLIKEGDTRCDQNSASKHKCILH